MQLHQQRGRQVGRGRGGEPALARARERRREREKREGAQREGERERERTERERREDRVWGVEGDLIELALGLIHGSEQGSRLLSRPRPKRLEHSCEY